MRTNPDIEPKSKFSERVAALNWDERLARLISTVTSPPLLGFLGLLLTAYTINSPSGWIWTVYYILITITIPVVYIVRKVRRGEITDFHMIVRAQRIRPMLLVLTCASTAWFGFLLGGAPRLFTIFGILGIFQIALLLAVTLRWKISGHGAAIGSMTVFLWGLYGPPAFMSLLAIPLVAWSRLKLRRHTLMQTIAGSITGIIFMLGLFALVFAYCQDFSLLCAIP